VLSFVTAAFFTGTIAGDALWRAGMAALLGDLVCLKLWPSPAKPKPAAQSGDRQ